MVAESTKDVLRSVWEDTAPQLARLAAAMGIGHDRRDDVLQDVYLSAWQNGPADLGPVELQRWLVRVAVNRCRLEQRRQSRWKTAWQGLTRRWAHSDSNGNGTPASRTEDHEFVRQALARLEDPARVLLVLRYFMELDSAEIGQILEQPDSTVRGQLREARRKLAGELKRAGYHHE